MSGQSKDKDILVVDDTIENLRLLVSMLSKQGYRVRPVNNGALALQIARTVLPNVILLDIRMPNMNGYEVCSRLKSDPVTRDIPVIFISAQHDIQGKLQAFRVGGVDYITKPFQLAEVRARVETQISLQELRQRDKEYIQNLTREIESRKRAEAQLLEYQQHLEEMVAERTAELRQALEQERSMRAQLIHADRLASMGQLSASIAHEIKNPMQSILGCLGLAREAVEEGEDPGRYFEVAEDAVHRVTDILGQMRELNRPPDDARALTDVTAVLHQVLLLTKKQCEQHNVEVVQKTQSDIQPVWATTDQIYQVFLNLVLNALDAMPQGGQLQITTTQTDRPPGVQIEFQDNGVGISPEHLPHIFEPFFTTKHDGSGLGLAVSYGIVHRHGGKLNATSQLGKGTIFTVWLPTTLR